MDVWLLGNGFDLAHNLPTGYISFLHTMEFLINHQNDIGNYKTIGNVFGSEELRKKDEFISASYKKYSELYDSITTDIKGIVEKANKNYWLKYFLEYFNRDAGWIDFEKEIGVVISAFKSFFKNKNLWYNRLFFQINKLSVKQIQVINYFNFFRKDDPRNMVNDDYTTEMPFGSGIIVVHEEKIIKTLFDSLREFSNYLSWYLNSFIDPISLILSEKDKVISKLEKADYIISFNYTYTVENLYEKKVCHIHGKDYNDNIVIGVNSDIDDKAESIDTLLLNFKKYFQRVRYNTDLNYLKIIDELKHPERKNPYSHHVLRIVGHSLDITDSDILRELFDLSETIIIYYHEEYKIGDYIENLVKLYGREGFDNLRKDRHLTFMKIQ